MKRLLAFLVLLLTVPAYAQTFEGESIPGMMVESVPSASGGNIGRLGAGVSPWQWVTLDQQFPAGDYKVSLHLYGMQDATADTLLYWVDKNGAHLPQNGVPLPKVREGEFADFSATLTTTGVSAIILKHGGEQGAGVGIDSLTIEAVPHVPPLHITAYKRLLSLPHMSGVDTSTIDKNLSEASILQTEQWLEVFAGLTEADQEVRYLDDLCRVPELKLSAFVPQVAVLKKEVSTAKRSLSAGQSVSLTKLSGDIRALVSKIEKRIGGQVMPDEERDPFTWLAAPILQGFTAYGLGTDATPDKMKETFSAEPTPYAIRWSSGASVRLCPPDAQFTVDRSWTGAVWKSGRTVVEFSTFSPAVRVSGLPELRVDDVKSIRRTQHGYLLDGKFFVTGEAVLEEGAARIKNPTWLVPAANVTDAEAWAKVFPRLPCSVVQVRRGSKVTQYFVGGSVAPVPPMLQYASVHGLVWKVQPHVIGGEWGKPVRSGEFDLQLPFAYIGGRSISYTVPKFAHPLAGRRGINAWSDRITPVEIASFKKDGANYLRLVLIEGPGQEGFDAWFAGIARILIACRESGITVSLDAHFNRNKYDDSLIDFWRKLASACAGYRDVVGAYDLLNEPVVESVDGWREWAERTTSAIRKIDPTTPVLVEAPRMANPTGMAIMPKLSAENVIYGFHMYYPHGFTHQAMLAKECSPESAPVKVYPAWVPMINWSDESWNEPVEWWDKWTLRGACLPLFRWWIEHGFPPMDNGEFGVIGYPQPRIPGSAERWTRDVMNLNEALHVSWALYGYHGGFGWFDPEKPVIKDFWRRNK